MKHEQGQAIILPTGSPQKGYCACLTMASTTVEGTATAFKLMMDRIKNDESSGAGEAIDKSWTYYFYRGGYDLMEGKENSIE